MSRFCEGCGKGPLTGMRYKRRGLAKAKGGVGRKIVGKMLKMRTLLPLLLGLDDDLDGMIEKILKGRKHKGG